VFSQLGDESPDVEEPWLLRQAFGVTQQLIDQRMIAAGHDRSDGGLATALLEMAFAGNCGIEVDLDVPGRDAIPTLFAEELGLVLEVAPEHVQRTLDWYRAGDVPCVEIGRTVREPRVRIACRGEIVLDDDMRVLRDLWEATSFRLEQFQANPACVAQEEEGLRTRTGPPFELSFEPAPTNAAVLQRETKPRVAIVREEGCNSDREMASAFHAAGFEAWDVTMSDLVARRTRLDEFRGVVFVGGFSFADVLDSAKGWAGVIRFNEGLRRQFDDFYDRSDTFSLGVCNGCQLSALLGWVPWRGIGDTGQPRFVQNASGRFESRFATVNVRESPALMLAGMEGSTLGIWVAHGEGRALFPDSAVLERVDGEGLAPIRFVDDQCRVTEEYPFNPNGSPRGIAALCSPDGRHLALMPHPERTFLAWQWGWMPASWKRELAASPWLRMFQNAREWCDGEAK
jgi:phosphoribosylformylglycinamidine synthase